MEEITGVSENSNWTKGYVAYADDWFMMSTPIQPLAIISLYLLFVLKIGPAYMKNRQAYILTNILHAYNFTQVLYSAYLVQTGTRIVIEEGLLERKCMLEDEAYTYRIITASHLYLIAKLSELLDTAFFVLRKKWNQITFLHVYHHTFMFLATWFVSKYSPSASYMFTVTFNSFVHVIMYTYYGFSAFPALQKYLWWKKYITKLQLIQFALVMIVLQVNRSQTRCPQSYQLLYLEWCTFLSLTFLFSKFYIDSYLKNKKDIVKKYESGIQENVANGKQHMSGFGDFRRNVSNVDYLRSR